MTTQWRRNYIKSLQRSLAGANFAHAEILQCEVPTDGKASWLRLVEENARVIHGSFEEELLRYGSPFVDRVSHCWHRIFLWPYGDFTIKTSLKIFIRRVISFLISMIPLPVYDVAIDPIVGRIKRRRGLGSCPPEVSAFLNGLSSPCK